MRLLAHTLLAVESASVSDPQGNGALRVHEKLRMSLTRFAGTDSFAALMRRSLALARLEVPMLQSVAVNADGSVEGLEQIPCDDECSSAEASIVLTSYLLALLVTFIGESLTLRLVGDAWPGTAFNK